MRVEEERMKESWMDKLIELLNEYDDNNWEVTDYWALFNRMNEWISETEDLQIISKKYWFIKWLVDNDKIDFIKLDDNPDWYDINTEREYLDLVALLSIQDEPTSFLISILK